MEIKYKKKNAGLKLSDLKDGDVFRFLQVYSPADYDVYIYIESTSKFRYVDLKKGLLLSTFEDFPVAKLKSALTVEEEIES